VAGLWDCLSKTWGRGGMSALYQGFGVSVQVRLRLWVSGFAVVAGPR